jgi:hypothetical protein
MNPVKNTFSNILHKKTEYPTQLPGYNKLYNQKGF